MAGLTSCVTIGEEKHGWVMVQAMHWDGALD